MHHVLSACGNIAGRFDLKPEGQNVDKSSMDVEKPSLQEIVDQLSVMVLYLRDENAKMSSTITALNKRLDKLDPAVITASTSS
jgi:uncharacterized coiled-coil protein SlyX